MKHKSIFILIICLWASQNVFAQFMNQSLKMWKGMLASPDMKMYVMPTGDPSVDAILKASFEKYWNSTPYVFLTPDMLSKERIPIVMITGEGMMESMNVVLASEGDIKRKIFDSGWMFGGCSLTPPTDKTPINDISFMIPFAVLSINRYVINEKNPNKLHNKLTSPSVLKEKTLLIPQEIAEDDKSKKLVSLKSLLSYRYAYKILPLKQIKELLADSSQSEKYCYFSYYSVLETKNVCIYDGRSCEMVLAYVNNNASRNIMTDIDFKRISDMIDHGER